MDSRDRPQYLGFRRSVLGDMNRRTERANAWQPDADEHPAVAKAAKSENTTKTIGVGNTTRKTTTTGDCTPPHDEACMTIDVSGSARGITMTGGIHELKTFMLSAR